MTSSGSNPAARVEDLDLDPVGCDETPDVDLSDLIVRVGQRLHRVRARLGHGDTEIVDSVVGDTRLDRRCGGNDEASQSEELRERRDVELDSTCARQLGVVVGQLMHSRDEPAELVDGWLVLIAELTDRDRRPGGASGTTMSVESHDDHDRVGGRDRRCARRSCGPTRCRQNRVIDRTRDASLSSRRGRSENSSTARASPRATRVRDLLASFPPADPAPNAPTPTVTLLEDARQHVPAPPPASRSTQHLRDQLSKQCREQPNIHPPDRGDSTLVRLPASRANTIGVAAMDLSTAELQQLLADLSRTEQQDGTSAGGLRCAELFPAREARYGEVDPPVHPDLRARLGIERLWSHQAEAITAARAGKSIVIASGTASGKSLCYQVPIAEAVSQRSPRATALLLFPTKALAHDQLRAFAALDLPNGTVATYDGDTPTGERAGVRARAGVVLTNPEMLHTAVLTHHTRWATFLGALHYVVVDELHVLRGVFGTHVAHVLRRLRRLCEHYGASPSFIFSSATIGQPGRLASALCGQPVAEILDDGSPRGPRLFAVWDPALDTTGSDLGNEPAPTTSGHGPASGSTASSAEPQALVGDNRAASRPSTLGATARVAATLIGAGQRTLVFCRSRKGTETVAADLARRLPAARRNRVRPYRGGFLPDERRDIEEAFESGELDGVVATSALELGIDIGGLDACVLAGFPGTIASMWQQAGRAGRNAEPAAAVMIAGDDQLDQWLVRHPEELFGRGPEPSVVNPANPYILEPHLACAAAELPLEHRDERFWPGLLDDGVRALVLADQLTVRPPRARTASPPSPIATWAHRRWPHRDISLRSSATDEIFITDIDGELVGTSDSTRAVRTVHPGAIYLHRGLAYRVLELDLDERRATVEPTDDDETTHALTETAVEVVATDHQRTVGTARLHLGCVEVTTTVVGYRRRELFTRRHLGDIELDLPPTTLRTRAIWYTVDPCVVVDAGLQAEDLPGTLHAIEHAAIGMLPLFAICDRWDVGGVSTALLADTGLPTIVIYDGYPGGAGVAELGFEAADRHLSTTLQLISDCECVTGCPSCVQSPKCGNLNEPLDKAGAVALLEQLVGGTATGRAA